MAYDKFAAVDSSTLLFPPSVRENLAGVSPNYVINGAFNIWQRGTSFTNPTTFTYTADRWQAYRGAFVSGLTISRQATGLTGFEYGIRLQRASGNTSTEYLQLDYAMESRDAIRLAGKNVTLSFYARAGADLSDTSLTSVIVDGTTTDAIAFNISGGTSTTQNVSLTTSWQRFSVTKSVASNSSQVAVRFRVDPTGTAGANDWFEVTGVQVEAGAVATPFRRNANSIQGELAACQRYYVRFVGAVEGSRLFVGVQGGTTLADILAPLPVEMRTPPTSVDSANIRYTDAVTFNATVLTIGLGQSGGSNKAANINVTFSANGAISRPGYLASTAVGGYVGFSAEL
jgi:hypothetical protein